MELFLKRMERDEHVSSVFTSNELLRAAAMEWMMNQVFNHFQALGA